MIFLNVIMIKVGIYQFQTFTVTYYIFINILLFLFNLNILKYYYLFLLFRKYLTEDSDFEFKNNDQNGDGYVTWKEIVGETDSNEDDENVILH